MSQIRTSQIQNLSGTTVLDTSAGTANLAPLAAGTTAKAPLVFTSGTKLSVPVDGAIEYNGADKTFYVTGDSVLGQGGLNESYTYSLAADRTIIATVAPATFYSMFGVGLNATPGTYMFEIFVGLRTGATSHTVSFAMGGTASYSTMQFKTEFTNLLLSTGVAAPGTPTAPVTLQFVGNPNSVANGVISPASTLVSKFFKVEGIMVVSGSGTINPQIGFSANPTGTNQVTQLSYVSIKPYGSTTLPVSMGAWI
jgi:hypothetical protein